jgi:triacylglycerol lipase
MPLVPRVEPRIPELLSPKDVEGAMPPAVDTIGRLEPKRYEFFQYCAEVPFEARSFEFSAIDAWYLSDCSFLAYTEAPTPEAVQAAVLRALSRMFGVTPEVKGFLGLAHAFGEKVLERGIQCIVVHCGHVGVVAFRGTLPHSLSNWLTDAGVRAVPEEDDSGMLVHAGFKAALDCLWKRGEAGGLEKYLTELSERRPDIRWWFTGHSLGAALAALGARRFGRAEALYTFGAPRVGNDQFVKQLRHSVGGHYRIVNHHDVVTRIPFTDPYVHGGRVNRVGEAQEASFIARRLLRLGDRSQLPPSFEEKLRGFFNKLGQLERGFEDASFLRGCLDHAPSFYSKLLWNQLLVERFPLCPPQK